VLPCDKRLDIILRCIIHIAVGVVLAVRTLFCGAHINNNKHNNCPSFF